ncbi:hypothetical protein ACTFIY_009682 [Dictyostelium cf. discoideum]
MDSSANFIATTCNVTNINHSPIQQRTNNNISIGDESFNNLSLRNVLDTANVPNPMERQRDIRRIQRPAPTPTQEPVHQIATEAPGGSKDCSRCQNISAILNRWSTNKDSNTRTKVADALAIYSKRHKNHLLKVYISEPTFFVFPALLSFFLKQINFDNFIDCTTGEEKQLCD